MTKSPSFIVEKIDAIHSLCNECKVLELSLFGSALTEAFDPANSDLDFLVEFSNPEAAGISDRYMRLAEGLETLFNRNVDLVTKPSIRNPIFREQVYSTSHSLYAA